MSHYWHMPGALIKFFCQFFINSEILIWINFFLVLFNSKISNRNMENPHNINIESQPQKRGRWTAKRKLALLNACKEHKPYRVVHGSRTEQWDKMLIDVNSQDPHLTPVKRHSMIDQLKQLRDTYKVIFEEFEKSPADTVNPDMLCEGNHVEKDKDLIADKKGESSKDKGKKKSEEAIAGEEASPSIGNDNKKSSPGGSGSQPIDRQSEIIERLDKSMEETRQMRQDIITLTKVVLDIKNLLLK
ncbi:uncharacterized protein EV154DRAFT_586906 [Mucor mucedo]|uniref:uncharacterized protein n=1 Tax=Mucor mucedo TaxID=29922 RepID=UPI00221EF0D3|nr:uncharacterized protein EV154DRAFT_586906 [Mucor mucedo]KAI7892205.1 hypothetical protein EV154DRAFT_586906 [Mucor mucedo]